MDKEPGLPGHHPTLGCRIDDALNGKRSDLPLAKACLDDCAIRGRGMTPEKQVVKLLTVLAAYSQAL